MSILCSNGAARGRSARRARRPSRRYTGSDSAAAVTWAPAAIGAAAPVLRSFASPCASGRTSSAPCGFPSPAEEGTATGGPPGAKRGSAAARKARPARTAGSRSEDITILKMAGRAPHRLSMSGRAGRARRPGRAQGRGETARYVRLRERSASRHLAPARKSRGEQRRPVAGSRRSHASKPAITVFQSIPSDAIRSEAASPSPRAKARLA